VEDSNEKDKKNIFIKSQINKFVTLKTNSHYRVSDIVCHGGARWKYDWDKIENNPDYVDTILGKYINSHTKSEKVDRNNPIELIPIIKEHGEYHQYSKPDKNELVVHLRLGDQAYHKSFFSDNYCKNIISDIIKLISENKNINKITFVGAFAYQVWTEESLSKKPSHINTWEYTDEIQQKNIDRLTYFFEQLIDKVNLPIKIYSNTNIDKDIFYCAYAHYIIPGQSGFSNMLARLSIINEYK